MRAKGDAIPVHAKCQRKFGCRERVLIVNLRFIEEVKKARWVRITDARYSQLSPLS